MKVTTVSPPAAVEAMLTVAVCKGRLSVPATMFVGLAEIDSTFVPGMIDVSVTTTCVPARYWPTMMQFGFATVPAGIVALVNGTDDVPAGPVAANENVNGAEGTAVALSHALHTFNVVTSSV